MALADLYRGTFALLSPAERQQIIDLARERDGCLKQLMDAKTRQLEEAAAPPQSFSLGECEPVHPLLEYMPLPMAPALEGAVERSDVVDAIVAESQRFKREGRAAEFDEADILAAARTGVQAKLEEAPYSAERKE